VHPNNGDKELYELGIIKHSQPRSDWRMGNSLFWWWLTESSVHVKRGLAAILTVVTIMMM
jgi:hypothetical protein